MYCSEITIIISVKEIIFIGLSRFDSQQDCVKTTQPIFINLMERWHRVHGRNNIYFGGNPDHVTLL